MTPEDLDEAFEKFGESAIRVETHQSYLVPAEESRLSAWREKRPRPVRSVVTSPWLERMARGVMADKCWARARIIEFPLSDYVRFEIQGYIESAACGEEIVVADRAACPELAGITQDFWIFDVGAEGEFAILMDYDDTGRCVLAEQTADPLTLRECKDTVTKITRHAEPFASFLARYQKSGLLSGATPLLRPAREI